MLQQVNITNYQRLCDSNSTLRQRGLINTEHSKVCKLIPIFVLRVDTFTRERDFKIYSLKYTQSSPYDIDYQAKQLAKYRQTVKSLENFRRVIKLII